MLRALVGGLALVLSTPGCKSRSLANPPAHPCRDSPSCARGEFCSYPDGRCGQGRDPGVCRPRPRACPEPVSPVCACDGRVYTSACAAHAAGADLSVTGGCRGVIPDWMACGARYCNARDSYCEIYLSDVPELPTDHACRPLPPTCVAGDGAPRGCDCFPPATPCLSFCGPMITGGRPGFHLTCQGVKPPPASGRGFR